MILLEVFFIFITATSAALKPIAIQATLLNDIVINIGECLHYVNDVGRQHGSVVMEMV